MDTLKEKYLYLLDDSIFENIDLDFAQILSSMYNNDEKLFLLCLFISRSSRNADVCINFNSISKECMRSL